VSFVSASRHSAPPEQDDPGVVVVAASAGGLAAYQTLLASLPPTFPLPILAVQHRDATVDYLAPILAERVELAVATAREGSAPRPGVVHVLPADRQLVLGPDGAFASTDAARCRADPLFASCAARYGTRSFAVVLSGRLDDGAAGVRAVKRAGGTVLVQDPATATASGMPLAAIATGYVDHVLPLETIAAALVTLATVPGAAELFRVRLNPWALASS